ncbi:ribosome modulation factor [Endozoicomonas acroporae]|uniref:ribosome modulation factor n=1 Tax=Endozoicomonas acroporae TaxID=1701104 RepID=UPI0013CFF67C|nr:ribosome modulation factor [Endozoicomonas acroporae]
MKRLKRDKSDRAFNKGYQVGLSGRSRDICPHQEVDLRQSWLSGWREGRVDNWEGMTGISGLHRMYNFSHSYSASQL